jgi:UDP-glucose 4-epimerase
LCKALCNLPITLRRNRRFSYLDVADFAPILAYFIENEVKYASYNVVPTHTTTLIELAKAICIETGTQQPVQVAETGLGFEYTGNNHRLLTEAATNGISFSFSSPALSISRLHQWYAERMESLDRELLKTDK